MIRILIDLRPLFYNPVSEETKQFILTCLSRAVSGHPENNWFVVADQSNPRESSFPIPDENWIIKKAFTGNWGWKYWYDWLIPGIIKKEGMGLFISTGGIASATRIPQGIWMPRITDSKKRSGIDRGYFAFYKRRLKKTLEIASSLFVFSENRPQKLADTFHLTAGKVFLVPSAANEGCSPLPWTEKENIKIRFAGGREYFLINGTPYFAECMGVLKAFSQFKKRQQSDMQLLFAVDSLSQNEEFSEKLASYKYRKDVFLYDRLTPEEKIAMLSAAYVLFSIVSENESLESLLNACKADVPVITTDHPGNRQTMADAALYMDSQNPDSLSELFISLYKDESLRKCQIENGRIRAADFNWTKTDSQVRRGISAALINYKPE